MNNTGLTEIDEFLYSIWTFYAANLSSRTSKNYYNIVKSYIKVTGKTPLKLTQDDAKQYNQHLIQKVQQGKLSYSTAVMRISVMRSLCEYIRIQENKQGHQYWNHFNDIIMPDEDKTITEEKLPDIKAINSLLEHIKQSNDNMFFLIISLVTKCGLTSSEVCGLCYEYIVFDTKDNICIKFPAKRKVSRIIKLPDDIAQLLVRYIEGKEIIAGPLFFNKHNTQLKVRDAERHLLNYIKECNIPSFTLQQLRHAAVKYMLMGGATEENVAKYCGITTKWMTRYKQVVDSTNVSQTADLSIITVKSIGN